MIRNWNGQFESSSAFWKKRPRGVIGVHLPR
jgi:hypothetical protein